jgi:hypothetical protein
VGLCLVDLRLVGLYLVDLCLVGLQLACVVGLHRCTFLLVAVLLPAVLATQMEHVLSCLCCPHWVGQVGLVLWLYIELRRLHLRDLLPD